MKNKTLIGTLIALALLVVAVLFVHQNQDSSTSSEDKVVKIGILQFVTHDALDEIERGIEDGLADAGYEGSNVELTVLNAEADQSKIQTMSKKLWMMAMMWSSVSRLQLPKDWLLPLLTFPLSWGLSQTQLTQN